MAFLDNLTERYTAKVNEINRKVELSKSEIMRKSLQSFITGIVDDTINTVAEHHSLDVDNEEIKKILDSKIDDGKKVVAQYGNSYSTVMIHIDRLHKERKELLDIKKELKKADIAEKFRTFILRVSTAVAIAGIILLTSYYAQKWGIPLPLRMGMPSP